MKLEFPSCHSPSSETPGRPGRRVLSVSRVSSPVPLHSCPPPFQAPPPFTRTQTHSTHGCPQGSATPAGPRPPGGESQAHHSSSAWIRLEREGSPTLKAQAVSCCPLGWKPPFLSLLNPGSAHFRNGKADVKVGGSGFPCARAELGQDQLTAHLPCWLGAGGPSAREGRG